VSNHKSSTQVLHPPQHKHQMIVCTAKLKHTFAHITPIGFSNIKLAPCHTRHPTLIPADTRTRHTCHNPAIDRITGQLQVMPPQRCLGEPSTLLVLLCRLIPTFQEQHVVRLFPLYSKPVLDRNRQMQKVAYNNGSTWPGS
jgi:hypothetical protein